MEELLIKGLQYCLDHPSTFARAYKVLTGEEVCSYCPGKIEAKFNEINNNKHKIKTMQERKYRMIPGKLIDTTMGNISDPVIYGMFTDKNMTDIIAEKLIANGYGKYFIKVKEEEIAPAVPEEVKADLETKEQEAEIKLEVFEKEKETVKEEAKNSLDTYSRARLVELCEKRGYPKEEWKDLVRKDLIKYVNGK